MEKDGEKGGDPDGTRTRVAAVKGRSLNRLTTGPFSFYEIGSTTRSSLYGSGNWIRTSDTAGMNRVL